MKILSAEFVLSAANHEQFPSDHKPQIAFAGRSNSGKSSIINALLHRNHLVKTSATPGKTQLINFFIVNGSFYFVDLPGYGYAHAPKSVTDAWGPMIEGYLKGAPDIAAVVILLDCRRTPDERDWRLTEWLRHYRIPVVYALTKTDKLNRQEVAVARKSIGAAFGIDDGLVATSAKTGSGIKELWSAINDCLQNARSESRDLQSPGSRRG